MKTELDAYFEKIEEDKPGIEKGFETFRKMIKEHLTPEALTKYLESGDGEKALQNLSDVRRVWCLLKVEALENKDLSYASFEEYVQDYELTLFSLRRLLFQLSEESCLEAITYLNNSEPSPYKLYFILKNEQLHENPIWKVMLPEIMKAVWSAKECEVFRAINQISGIEPESNKNE